MRYRSNLTCPDLSRYFKLLDPPKQIRGHDAPSDPEFEPDCTFWTHDEAAILYNVVKQVGGLWVDVGARFGWTTAHIAASANVIAVDPELRLAGALSRFESNTKHCWGSIVKLIWQPEQDWARVKVDGVVIDGNHDDPYPLEDAIKAHGATQDDAVILFHDFWGAPIRRAVRWLIDAGYQSKIYYTPNGVAVCWRGLPDFVPPLHVSDSTIEWAGIQQMIRQDGFGL
jgi:hypothetical protein